MSIIFPYRYRETPFGRLPDPIITLFVSTWYGWKPFDFLVDSGADMSMVPRSMAEWIGIDLEKLPVLRSYGVEGRGLKVFEGELNVKLGNNPIRVPCLFSSQEKTPFLLGRAGLFKGFHLTFHNTRNCIIFRSIAT